jgi:hypothetical protein
MRLGALAAAEPSAIGGLAEEALGARVALEAGAHGLEGERPRGRDHSAGTGWPRR